MPIAKTDDNITKFLMDLYEAGRKMGAIEAELVGNTSVMYDHSRVVPGALKRLSEAGFEIVRKGEPAKPAVAPFLGTVAVLTPDGERIVQAIAAGDFTTLSDREFQAFQGIRGKVVQASEVADQAGRVTELTAGIVINAPKGEPATPEASPAAIAMAAYGRSIHNAIMNRAPAPRAKAVRDLVQAHRLIQGASEVLGSDAADEILNSIGDSDEGEAA